MSGKEPYDADKVYGTDTEVLPGPVAALAGPGPASPPPLEGSVSAAASSIIIPRRSPDKAHAEEEDNKDKHSSHRGALPELTELETVEVRERAKYLRVVTGAALGHNVR